MDKKNKKYLSLIFIVFSSLFLTAIAIILLDFIIPYTIPSTNICYDLLIDLERTNKTIYFTNIFYVIYLFIYALLLIFLLIKILKLRKIKNILITTSILVSFNTFIMYKLIDMKVEMKENTIWMCELMKDSCEFSYKVLNNINIRSKTMIQFEKLKPCFSENETYSKKATLALEAKIQELKKDANNK